MIPDLCSIFRSIIRSYNVMTVLGLAYNARLALEMRKVSFGNEIVRTQSTSGHRLIKVKNRLDSSHMAHNHTIEKK